MTSCSFVSPLTGHSFGLIGLVTTTILHTPLLLFKRFTMRFPIVSGLLAASFSITTAAEDATAVAGGALRGHSPPKIDDRSLMEMDMYGPLMCNTGASLAITSDECLANATPLSSLINNAVSSSAANVIVPCGSCVTVDYTNSSTVTLPGDGSLHIKGRLHFPPTASVTLNATAIFVEGHLDIPRINEENEVKFSLYGSEEWYYYPHMMCTYGDTGCMHKKSVGKKPVVVAGGKYAYLMNFLLFIAVFTL